MEKSHSFLSGDRRAVLNIKQRLQKDTEITLEVDGRLAKKLLLDSDYFDYLYDGMTKMNLLFFVLRVILFPASVSHKNIVLSGFGYSFVVSHKSSYWLFDNFELIEAKTLVNEGLNDSRDDSRSITPNRPALTAQAKSHAVKAEPLQPKIQTAEVNILLKTKADILNARATLPNLTLQEATDLISRFVIEQPSRFPEDREEAVNLVISGILAAKSIRIGRDLSPVEAEKLIHESAPYAEKVLVIGLSGAVWAFEASGKVQSGAKWAGRAALIGVGALLGFSIG